MPTERAEPAHMLLEDVVRWLRRASWIVLGLLAVALLFVFGYVSQDAYQLVDDRDQGPLVGAAALFLAALGVGLVALLRGVARLLEEVSVERQAARRAARESARALGTNAAPARLG